jgi:ubiquinone/menaquinone biosynthesis C-methylase UbiE
MKNYNPIYLYNINTIRFEDITDDMAKQDNQITNFFWKPNHIIQQKLHNKLNNENIHTRIIDVACGLTPFEKATHLVDFDRTSYPNKRILAIDIDYDTFEYEDKYFNYVYSRHTLEDIQNPLHAFNEFIRIGKQGYIETPSPLIECMRGVDIIESSSSYCGYIHHRYIVWTKNDTLYFLPKYPLLEHIVFSEPILKKLRHIANNYPIYWNNYYTWDPSHPPKIVVYRNGVNFSLTGNGYMNYVNFINESIFASILSTTSFISTLP